MVKTRIETVKAVNGKIVREVKEVELSPTTGRVIKKPKKKTKGKESKLLKQKLLRSPKAKIKGISAEKALRGLAQAQAQQIQVRQVEQREIVPDNRSLFFRQEFIDERKEGLKFLS